MIRQLTPADFEAFYFIRREALRQNPEAFHTRLADFDAQPIEKERRRYEISMTDPDRFIVGAFGEDGQILGMTGFGRLRQSGYEHTGIVWGVFVTNSARGQRYGRRLLTRTIELARQIPNLTLARLSVVRLNEPAITLYEQLGFAPFEPHLIDPILGGACGSELHMQLELHD